MSQVERTRVCSDPYRAALEDPGAVVADLIRDVITMYWEQLRQKPVRIHLPDGLVALLEAHLRRVGPPLPAGKLVNKDQLFGLQPVYGAEKFQLELASARNAPQAVSLGVQPTDGDEPITEEDERQHPYKAWQAIVRDGDTRLGYEDWVRHRKDEARHDAQMEAVAMMARQDAAATDDVGDCYQVGKPYLPQIRSTTPAEAQPAGTVLPGKQIVDVTTQGAGPQETYRQIIVDVPKIDCDVMIKLPGGVDWIQVQLRPSNADTNYNGSLDVILPRDQAVTCWSGDSMRPSQPTDDPNTRIGKQLVTELSGDYT